MKNIYRYIPSLFIALAWISAPLKVSAQSGKYEILESEYNNSNELFYFKPHASWNKTKPDQLPSILSDIYGVPENIVFRSISTSENAYGTIVKINQTYNGIDVYGGDLLLKYDTKGILKHVFGTLRKVNTKISKPEFNSERALEIAYKESNSSRIHLDINPETGKYIEPKIKLKYAPKGGELLSEYILTYEVELVLVKPDRLFYYINASTGEVEDYYSALMHSNGTGQSLYSGTVGFRTTQQGAYYYLVDSIRNVKSFDHLYNRLWMDITDPSKIRNVKFPDQNNNWGADYQKAAADVQWGMSKVYDYYKNVLTRNSYDDIGSAILNRVHCDNIDFTDRYFPLDSITAYDSTYNNAFWNGTTMSFGDGDGNQFSALVSLDVAGHEFTHAVVENTAGLIYKGESGALNESFADIFGTCIEFYGKPSIGGTGNYLMGEECYTPGSANDALRNISDPNSSGSGAGDKQPDTYQGDHWHPTAPANNNTDQGGVHYNSGVGNFWFYLLSEGGNGTNDKNKSYSVTKIGRNKAEKLAYLTLLYMTSGSDYQEARKASLVAAEDLFGGDKTTEYKQVCNAWYAVNVGKKCCGDSMELEFKVKDAKCIDSKDGEIELTIKNSNGPFEYKWYKSNPNGPVISTNKNQTGLDTGRYYAWVKDTVAKCEVIDKTQVKSPDKMVVTVIGGGTTFWRACEPAPKVTLYTFVTGGKTPYTFNWPNEGKLIVGSSGTYTAIVKDKNNCKANKSTIVTFIPVLCSKDPNDIVGPTSFGPKKFVSKFATLKYKVRFENDPKFATAPASKVTVDLPIDNNMDMNTFRVSSFGFNNWVFDVPADLTTYSKRLDLTDSLGIYLDVTAGIDQSAKKAFWIFESIDPSTGLPPTLGTMGFLPINDSTIHNGEGFVDFTIRAKTSTVTGDSLRAIADIVFDDNDVIATPRIHNIIDAKPPVSKMDSMPSIMDSTSFVLKFKAKDDTGGSGVSNTNLMVSENNGPYAAYQKNVTDTFFSFSGNSGSFYRFYTQTADNVDNREDAKPNPDVSLTITPKNFLLPIDTSLNICTSDTFNVKWKKVAITNFDLQYAADTGAFKTFATGMSGADTNYRWKIPVIASSTVKVKIRAVSSSSGSELDISNSFTIQSSPATQLANDTFYCDGSSINLVLDAGAGFTSYFWSDSSTNRTLSVSKSGTYGVTVINSYGCKAFDETTVTKALRPVVSSKMVTGISCYGNTNAAISIVTVSGTAPYQFLWNTADTIEDLSNLSAGTYSLLITDKKGCFTRDTTYITEPAQLLMSKGFTNVKCKNGNDGSIDLNLSGGTGAYSYLWSNSATTEDLSGLAAGLYKVTVRDANNCQIKDSITITEPALLTSSKTKADVKCKNGNDGSIDLIVNGGTTPYTYLWSNNDTTQDLSGLTAGTYTIVITDANACIRRDTVTITEPTQLAKSTTFVNVKCKNGNDGSIDLSVNGGTTPYTYLWSNSATTQDISTLTAGTYSVIITDANTCILRDTTVITEPTLLTKSRTSANVKCKNGNDGSIDLTVNGGTTPYTYLWSNSATTQDITTLTAGTYSVTVTDANSCIVRDTTIITEPALLISSKTKVDVKCKNGNDGSIDLTVSGGVTPYTYLWSNSATTQDISGLIAGTYSVVITDANSCIRRDTVIITEPALLVSSKTSANVKCKNGNDGSIDLTVSGGTAPYTYLWSNSATTEDISTLTADTYTVIITDANACIRKDTVIITEPALLTKSKTSVNVKCKNGNDGSIDLNINGGTTPYTYLWSNSATTQDISTLTAGTYSVIVTDANSCIVRDTTIITEPTLLVSSKTKVDVKCKNGNDGSIDLTVSGGVTPYTYLWNNSANTEDLTALTAGTYTVRITDANSCIRRDTVIITEPALIATTKTITNVKCKNGADGIIDISVTGGVTPYAYLWSNSATTQDISSLIAGTYNVRITDANGCIRRDTFTVTEPVLLTKSKTSVNVKCKNGNDGSIDLSVNGGTTPYTYLWSNSATTQDITTLTAGTYSVRVTDANSCIVRDTTIITEPTLLISSKTKVDVKCKNGNNGSIDLTVSGGVTPYTYLWSNSATTQDLTTLTAGTYSVRITDGNGCIRRDTVIITEPTLLVSSKTSVNVKCKNGNDGTIDLSVSGGTSPYTYLWNNTATTQDISGLTAGTYSVIITDANACIRLDTVIITEPALLTKFKTFANVKCNKGNDGSIDLTVVGGTTPYTYIWSNGAGTQDISTLIAGTYSVIVMDAQGCIVRDTTTITEPTKLAGSKTFSTVKCKNGNDGSIDLTVTGGTIPYTYLWSNSAITQDIATLKAGTYSVRVTDANACIIRDTVVITEPTLLLSSITVNDVLCHAGSDGSISSSGTGGVAPYTYLWNTGESSSNISNKTKGQYIVLITDNNLCFRRDTMNINEPVAPLSIINTIANVNCFAGTDGSVDLTTAGGTTPYNFLWSNTKTTEDINGEKAGTYSILITDKNNCTLRDTFTITEPLAPLSYAKFILDVKCFAGNDGAIDLTPAGGTVPYNFIWNNSATSEDINGLTKGRYTFKITDKNNCILTDSMDVKQPSAPLSSVLAESKVNCFGGNDGAISTTISGGTVPYTYKWSNGALTKNLSNVIQGKYNLLVTDSNNCILADSIIVTEPAAPLKAVLTVDDVDCHGDNTGAVSLVPSGGTPTYTFTWSNGASTQNIIGLTKGIYKVTVKDANSCSYSDSAIVPEPTELNIQAFASTATNSDKNGFAWSKINGGTPPYSIEWNDMASQTTDTATNLSTGEYIVTVIDAKGCTKSDTVELKKAPDPSTIALFPNPNQGVVTIVNLASLGLDETIFIDVIDMAGKVCTTYEVKGKDSAVFEMIDSFRNSTYIIKIHNSRGIQNRRLILIR